MIKYFVRTTNDRIFEYDLECETLVDLERKPVKSFIDQLKYISQWNSVLLEDDLILCKNFKARIEEVIKRYPDKVINFFTRPNDWYTTHESNSFLFNQCTYYPKGLAMDIAFEMEKVWKMLPKAQYDVLECNALNRLGLSHVQYRPCLVQHLDNDSLVGNTYGGFRRTPYFIDYLDELAINYENAFKVENRSKLEKLLAKEVIIQNGKC